MLKEETLGCYPTPRYEIKKKGYRKLPPKDRKIIYLHPYYNDDRELRYGKKLIQIVRGWNKKCKLTECDYDITLEKNNYQVSKTERKGWCINFVL